MKRRISHLLLGIFTLFFTIHYPLQQFKKIYHGIQNYVTCKEEDTSDCNDRYTPIKKAIHNENTYILYETKKQQSNSWFKFQVMYLMAPDIPKGFAGEYEKKQLLTNISTEEEFTIISKQKLSELDEITTHNYYANEYYIYKKN